MRDGRQDAGNWNWLANPLRVLALRAFSLLVFVIVVAKELHGFPRTFLICVAAGVFVVMVMRDIRRGDPRTVEDERGAATRRG